MKRCVALVPSRVGRAGVLLLGTLVAWYLWLVSRGVASQYELELTSSYLVAPVALIAGIVVGGVVRRLWQQGNIVYLLILVLIATIISWPIYINASAAVGGLLIALVGLGTLDLREATRLKQPWSSPDRRSDTRILRHTVVLAVVLCAGVLLILDAQAAVVLSVPLAMIIVFALWKRSGPPQWMAILLGFLVAAGAMLVVVFLGSRTSWPGWLAASKSLSSARHTLWSDALSLWATQPVIGAGPGSFIPSSELATTVPSLAAVHSLPLQVGSELGAVGVVLLGGLFLAGLLFAARGNRPVAFIAIAGWTALAVHSSIDHLEDFPIVAFMGGVILGWSGFNAHPLKVARRTADIVGRE